MDPQALVGECVRVVCCVHGRVVHSVPGKSITRVIGPSLARVPSHSITSAYRPLTNLVLILDCVHLFQEYWKRRENDLAFLWDVHSQQQYKTTPQEAAHWSTSCERRINPISLEEENWFDPLERRNRTTKALLVTMFSCALAIAVNFGAIELASKLNDTAGIGKPWGQWISALALTLSITIGGLVFEEVVEQAN